MKVPAFFTSEIFPNCHIEFDGEGLKLRVSLNIEPRMRKYLSPNNVFKAEKFYIYSICCRVKDPTLKTLESSYRHLMKNAMINCREAKIAAIHNEIETISKN